MSRHVTGVPIECHSPEGTTIGLIDAVNAVVRAAAGRVRASGASPAVREALRDLAAEPDLAYLLDAATWGDR